MIKTEILFCMSLKAYRSLYLLTDRS